MATALKEMNEVMHEEDSMQDETWQKVRLEKVTDSTSSENAMLKESVICLQQAVMRLEDKLSTMSTVNMNNHNSTINQSNETNALLENKLINQAQKRLRFDIKDVHNSIDSWNHFFRMYGVHSDFDKYFAVEQLLPAHVQRALRTRSDIEPSYIWLIEYLRNKYDPKYLCHEMPSKNVNRSTNINELEDMAAEAASCPREHVIKHFMLDACAQHIKNKMRHHILLPMREFKLKLKMILQEDGNRFHNSAPSQNFHSRNGNQSSQRAINALNEENSQFVQNQSESIAFSRDAGNAQA